MKIIGYDTRKTDFVKLFETDEIVKNASVVEKSLLRHIENGKDIITFTIETYDDNKIGITIDLRYFAFVKIEH